MQFNIESKKTRFLTDTKNSQCFQQMVGFLSSPEKNMYPLNNIPRVIREESVPESKDYDESAKNGGKLSTVSRTNAISSLSHQPNTAGYLWSLSRPPLEHGAQGVTDASFQRFLQGDIPDAHNDRLQIAETCLNHHFPSSLAWLFVKTEMTEFIYRGSGHGDRLSTLGSVLEYSGLPLTSLVIEMKRFSLHEFCDIGSKPNKSDSLKKINLSGTVLSEYILGLFRDIKGPNSDIFITGGILESTTSGTPSIPIEKTLPAVIFSPRMAEAISRVQLKIQRMNAISAIENTRNFKVENQSKVRQPDISGFSEAVQTALLYFFRSAYEIPHFMLHTTSSFNMGKILSMGSLTSRARLEKLPGKSNFHGLKDTNDVRNNNHRMIFAAVGTNADNIRRPSAFDMVKKEHGCSSFLIDVDLFMQNNRSARKHMIVKSCDWGDSIETSDEGQYVTQMINIPDTSITITRLGMDAQNGAIKPGDMIRFKYENRQNGYSKQYVMPVYDDIVTGVNYRQLVPLLLVQHLRQLDEGEQLAVLGGITGKAEGSGEQKHAVNGLLEAFSPLEIGIPGSLPLRLEYLDLIRHDKQIFDIKAIRNAVQQGRVGEFVALLEKLKNLPGSEVPDWLINGIHGIAMKNWLTERTKSGSGPQTDRFLAILDFIEPMYQKIWLGSKLDYKPDYTSLDLLKVSDDLNALAVPPSRVNRLIVKLSENQEKVEAYLENNRNTTIEALNQLRQLFNTAKDVSKLGLQSNLKAKLIGSRGFNELVKNKDTIKSLIYLASAAPALIAKIFGEIDLNISQAENGFTELDIIVSIGGIKKVNSQSHVNRSFLSDLLFNIPGNSLFVPGNGMPDHKTKPFSPEDIVKAVDDYRLLFSALRGVLREENLIDTSATTGEQLLRERYEPGKWSDYKNRFLALAELSKHSETITDGGENRYLKGANDVIRHLSVMDPEYARFNLDPRHLQAVLAGNYGKAKPAFDELIETIAANPEADENHRTTAIQLFHRMKLLEFEFYKDQLISGLKLGFDEYAHKVLASMKLQ